MALRCLIKYGGRLARSSNPGRHRVGSLTGNLVRSRSIYTTTGLWQKQDQVQENVILMGSPGSGKTTVGQILAPMLGKLATDIDNDHLENYWKMPVFQKLKDVGGDKFVEEEGKATLEFKANGHVVSLSGSNPMYKPAMHYLRKIGVVVFIDAQNEDIVARLERMKVNRIVGQGEGVPMTDILKYRQQFYEGNYDLRVICEAGEAPESIAQKVKDAYRKYKEETLYESTRGSEKTMTFPEVVLQGQADDGGLFVPSGSLPRLSAAQWERLIGLSYPEKAVRILEQWIHPKSISPNNMASMLSEAYSTDNFETSKVFPVIKLAHNQYIQELFHGPTASFKDSALQLMPKMFHHAMQNCATNDRFLILVATSGDTGGAVLDGFSKLPDDSGVSVMVLFPEKGISAIQKAQMTSAVGSNVHVIGVNADFDFCQSFIKKVFADRSLKDDIAHKTGYKISAANSINWGRLLPQIIHQASAYLNLVQDGVISYGESADLCVPTGNFGNILAAYYSQMMGIPWRRLICASNVNDILTDFINTGVYDLKSRHLHLTSSPAIDILKSSNMERFLYHLTGGKGSVIRDWYKKLETDGTFSIGNKYLSEMQETLSADWCSEEDCFKTITNTWKDTGYLLDPHTAVAKTVADRHQEQDVPMVISSTAHHAKFADDVLQSISDTETDDISNEEAFARLEHLSPSPRMHDVLRKCVLDRPTLHKNVVDANYNEIVKEIKVFLQRQM